MGAAAVDTTTATAGFNKEWPLKSRTAVRSRGAIVYPFCIFSARDGVSLNLLAWGTVQPQTRNNAQLTDINEKTFARGNHPVLLRFDPLLDYRKVESQHHVTS